MEIDYNDQNPEWLSSGEIPPVYLWAEHFQRPSKQKNVLYTKYFEERLALCKFKYVFLTDTQLYGMTLNELKIPSLGSKIKPSFLNQHKSSCKKQNKDVSRSQRLQARRCRRLFEDDFDDSSSTNYDFYRFSEQNEKFIQTKDIFESDVYDNLSEMFQSVAIQPYKSLPRKTRPCGNFNQNYSRKSVANLKDNGLLGQFKIFKDLTEVSDRARKEKSILKNTNAKENVREKKKSSIKSVQFDDDLEKIYEYSQLEDNEISTLEYCSPETSTNNLGFSTDLTTSSHLKANSSHDSNVRIIDESIEGEPSNLSLIPQKRIDQHSFVGENHKNSQTLQPGSEPTDETFMNKIHSIDITLQTAQPTKKPSIISNEIDELNSYQKELCGPSTKEIDDVPLLNETSEKESSQSQQHDGSQNEFICNSFEESNNYKSLFTSLKNRLNMKRSIQSETNVPQKDGFLSKSPDIESLGKSQLANVFSLNDSQCNDILCDSHFSVVNEFETVPHDESFQRDSQDLRITPSKYQSQTANLLNRSNTVQIIENINEERMLEEKECQTQETDNSNIKTPSLDENVTQRDSQEDEIDLKHHSLGEGVFREQPEMEKQYKKPMDSVKECHDENSSLQRDKILIRSEDNHLETVLNIDRSPKNQKPSKNFSAENEFETVPQEGLFECDSQDFRITPENDQSQTATVQFIDIINEEKMLEGKECQTQETDNSNIKTPGLDENVPQRDSQDDEIDLKHHSIGEDVCIEQSRMEKQYKKPVDYVKECHDENSSLQRDKISIRTKDNHLKTVLNIDHSPKNQKPSKIFPAENEFETVPQEGSLECDSQDFRITPENDQSQTVTVQFIDIINEEKKLEEKECQTQETDNSNIKTPGLDENVTQRNSQEDEIDLKHHSIGEDVCIEQSGMEKQYKKPVDSVKECYDEKSYLQSDNIPIRTKRNRLKTVLDIEYSSKNRIDNMKKGKSKYSYFRSIEIRPKSSRSDIDIDNEMLQTNEPPTKTRHIDNKVSYFKSKEIAVGKGSKQQQTCENFISMDSSKEYRKKATHTKNKKFTFESIKIPIMKYEEQTNSDISSEEYLSCETQVKENEKKLYKSACIPIRKKSESDHSLDQSKEFHSFESFNHFSNHGNEDISENFSFERSTEKFDEEDNKENKKSFKKNPRNSLIFGTSIQNMNINRHKFTNSTNNTEEISSLSDQISSASYGEDVNDFNNHEASINSDLSPNTALDRLEISEKEPLDSLTLEADSPGSIREHLSDSDVSISSESQHGYSKIKARKFGDELDSWNKIGVDGDKSDEESLSSTLELMINRKRKAMDESVITVPVSKTKLKKQKQSDTKSCTTSLPIGPVPSTSSFNKSLDWITNNQFERYFKPNLFDSKDSPNNFEVRFPDSD